MTSGPPGRSTTTSRSNPEFTVRRADADDRAALAELRWAWRVDEEGESGIGHDAFVEQFTAWAADRDATHVPFIADVDGAAVGMAWLVVVERIPGPGAWPRLSGNLLSVYVRPDHRDGGIGQRLVDAALEEGRRRGMSYMVVHPTERAFSLYRRAGFAETPRLLEIRFS